MVTFLKREDPKGDVVAHDSFSDDTWVNAIAPDTARIDELSESLGIKHDLILDALDPSEVPRMQEDDGNVYVFVRVPFGEGDAMTTIPALLVLGQQFLLTVCAERLPILERFIGGHISYSTQWRSQMFLKILSEVVLSYQHSVNMFGKSLRAKIANFGEIDDKDILKLVAMESVMNDFMAALMPMHTLLPQLTNGKVMKIYDDDHDLIEDVQLAMGQVVESVKGLLKTTVNFRQAYSVIATNNLNRIIKVLTLFTVVLTVPMVVSGLYGMNVHLPYGNHPLAFFFVIGTTVLIIAGLLRYLWVRKLL